MFFNILFIHNLKKKKMYDNFPNEKKYTISYQYTNKICFEIRVRSVYTLTILHILFKFVLNRIENRIENV